MKKKSLKGFIFCFLYFSGRRTPAKKPQPSSLAEAMIMDTEAAVMANLDFLANADVDMDDDEDMGDDVDIETADDIEEDVKIGKKGWLRFFIVFF